MGRFVATCSLALLTAGTFAVAGAEDLSARNEVLVKQHTEIWNLMGLSKAAQDELNGLVTAINTKVAANAAAHPEAFARTTAVKRAEKPTHEEYTAQHRRRFDMLEISEPTQKELLDALEMTWRAMHDPNVPEEERTVAETIRNMMTSMGGPPPCCDDNLFLRAGNLE